MDTQAIRKEIHELVDKADDSMLYRLYTWVLGNPAIFHGSSETEVAMIKHAEASEREIDEGRLRSSKQFRSDFESWKKNRKSATK